MLSLVAVVSCNPPKPAPISPTPAAIEPVRVGFSAWPGWFPWQVAQELKLFERNGVPVELKWFDDYLDSITALNNGQIDANSQTLNDTISSLAVGTDLVVVLTNDYSTGNDQVIVSGEIDTIAALKGKKVAVEEATVDHFLLLSGLQKAGLQAKDIMLKPMETAKAAEAFAAGQFDAVAVFAPYTSLALKRPGSKVLFSSKEFPGTISDHLVFSRKFTLQHSEQVQAVVNTWFDTLDAMKANRAKAISIMAKRAQVSFEDYQTYNAGTKILSLGENIKAFKAAPNIMSLPYAAQKISEFLSEAGLATKKPNLSELFDDRFVKARAHQLQRVTVP